MNELRLRANRLESDQCGGEHSWILRGQRWWSCSKCPLDKRITYCDVTGRQVLTVTRNGAPVGEPRYSPTLQVIYD